MLRDGVFTETGITVTEELLPGLDDLDIALEQIVDEIREINSLGFRLGDKIGLHFLVEIDGGDLAALVEREAPGRQLQLEPARAAGVSDCTAFTVAPMTAVSPASRTACDSSTWLVE